MSVGADDAVLIKRAQSGDRASYDSLVHKYQTRAYQYAYRLSPNQDEACDLVADAFVRVYTALPNFRGQSSFGTWLYRIITNCYLDARKKDKSKLHVPLDLPGEHGTEFERPLIDATQRPDVDAERNEREHVVQSALEHIPEYQKAMLLMYHVENLSYEEIAEALDLPLGTVKSRLNRARLSLRDQLSDNLELFEVE